MKISRLIGRMIYTRAKMEATEKGDAKSARCHPITRELCREIRKRWVDSGMNASEFSKLVEGGGAKTRLSLLLNGRRGVSFPTVIAICNALDIDLGEFQKRFKK
jgi:hypothetical protein